jgi:hypothetical protein
VFECVSDGTYLDIRHVSLEPAEGIDSDTVFTGPVFSELDDELQESFRAYVAVRDGEILCLLVGVRVFKVCGVECLVLTL